MTSRDCPGHPSHRAVLRQRVRRGRKRAGSSIGPGRSIRIAPQLGRLPSGFIPVEPQLVSYNRDRTSTAAARHRTEAGRAKASRTKSPEVCAMQDTGDEIAWLSRCENDASHNCHLTASHCVVCAELDNARRLERPSKSMRSKKTAMHNSQKPPQCTNL